MREGAGRLWRHSDFMKLWTGETLSLFGSQVTALALPLSAVLVLRATPAQMGILAAAEFAPFLLVTLFAGVWVDRVRRRPILIATDLGQALVLTIIPLLAALGALSTGVLYLAAFLLGSLQVPFQLAYQAYLPTLVSREHILEGNSKLQMSGSAAQVGGPAVAGVIVQTVGAPFALLVDAVSFLISAGGVASIRLPEPKPEGHSLEHGMWRAIGIGLRAVLANSYLRALAGDAATYNLFASSLTALFVLYASRTLHITPGDLGLIFAAGGIGALVGSAMADRAARRVGVGPAIVGATAIESLVLLVVPLVHGPYPLVLALLAGGFGLNGFGLGMTNVLIISLRQTLIPDRLLGRINAGYRFVVTGAAPLGALLGGALGQTIGLRGALAVGAVGASLAVVWLLTSPVAGLRRFPSPMESAVYSGKESTER